MRVESGEVQDAPVLIGALQLVKPGLDGGEPRRSCRRLRVRRFRRCGGARRGIPGGGHGRRRGLTVIAAVIATRTGDENDDDQQDQRAQPRV